jgi:hypothetical protein
MWSLVKLPMESMSPIPIILKESFSLLVKIGQGSGPMLQFPIVTFFLKWIHWSFHPNTSSSEPTKPFFFPLGNLVRDKGPNSTSQQQSSSLDGFSRAFT